MTDEQLSALLRIKRFEQPPPGYFDQLLRDVHRRQRDEALRQPVWKMALERMGTFFSEHSMGPASYAGAMAAVLVAGIVAIGVVIPGKGNAPAGVGSGTLAKLETEAPSTVPKPERLLTLQTSNGAGSATMQAPSSISSARSSTALQQPRYIIDARPVSYEPSFAF